MKKRKKKDNKRKKCQHILNKNDNYGMKQKMKEYNSEVYINIILIQDLMTINNQT